jgi:GGDEF domain-containing protein
MYKGKTDEKLLQELLNKGYGEDERKLRREKWLRNQKVRRDLEHRRNGRYPPSIIKQRESSEEMMLPPEPADESDLHGRDQDAVKSLASKLRRRIDAYAYRNGYLVTGLFERCLSICTVFFPHIKDYINKRLLRRLVRGKGFRWNNPFDYCLMDNLDALAFSSRFLLGSYKISRLSEIEPYEGKETNRITEDMAQREPFALDFFTRFAERDEMLMRSLEFIKLRMSRGARVEVMSLAGIVKSVYRLILGTGSLDPERLIGVFSTVVSIHKKHEKRARQLSQVDENMGLFQMAYANLFEFKHQLFPLLLKIMGTFFPEESGNFGEDQYKICEFLSLAPESIIKLPEEEEAPQKSGSSRQDSGVMDTFDVNREEREVWDEEGESTGESPTEPVQTFHDRYKRELSILKYLFPGSGIKDMETWPCFLPYFDLKVYNKDLTFSNLIQNISRSDPMGQIMVLHRIVDNMLTSIEIFSLDEILSKRGKLAGQMSDIITEWQKIYPSIFDGYLKELNDYVHMVTTDGGPSFNLSPMIHRLEENINQIKNLAIHHYGKIMVGIDNSIRYTSGVRLYKLVEELNDLLGELGEELNLAQLKEKNPAVMRMWNEIAHRRVVDFKTNSYKPATIQMQKYIQAKYQTPISRVPMEAQAEFFDALFAVVGLYDFLLNDPVSYFLTAEGKVFHAGEEERKTWQRVRESLSNVSFRERPQEGDYVLDSLTGLISREYWDESLPEKREELNTAGKTYSLIYASIDGYQRIKEYFPQRSYGNRILKLTAKILLNKMKVMFSQSHFMETVRMDENGLLVLVFDRIEAGAQIAEDIRIAHREKLKGFSFSRELNEYSKTHGNIHCGTLSLGVAERENDETLLETINRVKDAAVEALKRGDTTIVHPIGTFISYKDLVEDTI